MGLINHSGKNEKKQAFIHLKQNQVQTFSHTHSKLSLIRKLVFKAFFSNNPVKQNRKRVLQATVMIVCGSISTKRKLSEQKQLGGGL